MNLTVPSSQNTCIPSALQSQVWFPHYAPLFNPQQAKNGTSLQVPLAMFLPHWPSAAPDPTAMNMAQASISATERVTLLHLWGYKLSCGWFESKNGMACKSLMNTYWFQQIFNEVPSKWITKYNEPKYFDSQLDSSLLSPSLFNYFILCHDS